MSVEVPAVRRLGRVRTRRPARPAPPAPILRRFVWLPGDVIGLLWTTVGGLAALLVSYLGVSSTDRHGTQTAWVALAIGALLLTGLGNAVWLASGARAVAERRHALMRRLEGLAAAGSGRDQGPLRPPSATRTVGEGLVVATDAMTRYHRADCLLARGKPVTADTAASHRDAGRRPCGVCLPDGGVA